jgi:hypothetical protein
MFLVSFLFVQNSVVPWMVYFTVYSIHLFNNTVWP